MEEERDNGPGVVIPLFRLMVEMVARGILQSQHPATHKNVSQNVKQVQNNFIDWVDNI